MYLHRTELEKLVSDYVDDNHRDPDGRLVEKELGELARGLTRAIELAEAAKARERGHDSPAEPDNTSCRCSEPIVDALEKAADNLAAAADRRGLMR